MLLVIIHQRSGTTEPEYLGIFKGKFSERTIAVWFKLDYTNRYHLMALSEYATTLHEFITDRWSTSRLPFGDYKEAPEAFCLPIEPLEFEAQLDALHKELWL